MLFALGAGLGRADETGQCKPDDSTPDCAEAIKKLMPKFDAGVAAAAFKDAGWSCAEYDLELGLMCRGHVPGYSDEIAVIVPRRFVPHTSKTNMILHIHGNQWGGTNDDLLKRFEFPKLLEKSQRMSLMIVPLSNATVTKDNHAEMRDPAKFNLMMGSLLMLFEKAGLSKSVRPGHIAITAHSGGYKTTAALLGMKCELAHVCYRDHIKEVHLLDATYGEEDTFAKFANEDGHRFTDTFIPNSYTSDSSLNILKQVSAARIAAGQPVPKILTTNSRTLKDSPNDYAKYNDADLRATNPAFIHSDKDHNATVNKYLPAVLYDSR